jgi:plasmid stabilization system protein ParE
MARRLIVSRRAAREAGEAYEWYEEQRPGLGLDFLEALQVQLDLIQKSPRLFAEVIPGVRRTLLAHFPYGVFYASKGEIISILAVVHTSRNPRRWPRR